MHKYELCLVEVSEKPRADVVHESVAKRSKRSTWDSMYDEKDCAQAGDLLPDDVLKVYIIITTTTNVSNVLPPLLGIQKPFKSMPPTDKCDHK